VAGPSDIQPIEQFKPRDATTNLSLMTAAAQMPQYQAILDETFLSNLILDKNRQARF
jgi:transaldolase